MYRDKIEHKYLVIHLLAIIMYTEAIIMYTDLLYFYSFLLNPKNIRLLSLKSVGKHTIGVTAHLF